MMESKKLAILRILEILKKYTDILHPLTQEQIAEYLKQDYGIVIERKAIGRNLSLLKEAGYEIETNHLGSYLEEREFEDAELKLLIDGVLCSRYIHEQYSKDLIQKLCHLSNKYFEAHVKNIHTTHEWSKTESKSLFYNIEMIDEAINQHKQIKFYYNKYDIDKKLHYTKTQVVSPYLLLVHNQHYFLMAYHEYFKNIVYYRLDHINNILILEEQSTDLKTIKGYENGINYEELSTSYPYFFTDELQIVTFLADKKIIDDIIDWFGYTADLVEEKEKVKVRVKASPSAMKYWALQYLNFVEILEPKSLREELKQDIKNGLEKYSKKK